MHNAKAQYNKCIRQLRGAEGDNISDNLNDCLLRKNMNDFLEIL